MKSHKLNDVIAVEVLDDYRLRLEFDDGVRGCVDIASLVPFEGVFEAVKDKQYFSTVVVNPDTGTICWDNGADISPEVLRESIEKCA